MAGGSGDLTVGAGAGQLEAWARVWARASQLWAGVRASRAPPAQSPPVRIRVASRQDPRLHAF